MSFSRHGILATVCLLALCLCGAERLDAACVPQLGGFYQFWPADGNAYDVHGTDHGVLKNGATYAAGKVGLAFSFDGVDDYVEIPDNNIYVTGGNFFTIEFWVKFNSVRAGTFTAPGTIFVGNDEGPGNRDKWYFAHTGSFLFFHINNPADLQQFIAHAAFNPVTNQWYHLAVVRTSGSTYKIYINGVEAISEVNTNPIPNTIAPLTLGQAENTGFLNGQLDEVTIYNYDLTPAELLAIVNAGTDGKCRVCTTTPSGLTDWWPGNGNALDVQGTNSGTLIGGTTFGNSGWVGEAFSFNGVDGAVTTTRDLPYNSFSNMTWECWVYPARTNYGRQQIMSIDDGGFDFSLLIEGNSFAVFTGNQSWIPPNQLVYPFEWQHLAVVFTPTNVEFYRNGVRYSLGSGAVYGGSNSRFNIGRNPAFGEYFQGMIDEVAIYNRALTETEIQQIYASANSGKCRVTTAGPRIEASPLTLGFGPPPTTIGQTNERTLVVQNTGSTTLSNSLAISNSVFSIASPDASFTVAPNDSQPVKVWFIPTAATNYSGTLTITHNDPIRPSIVVDLIGTGEPPGVCTNPPSGLVSWWRAENYSAADARGTNDGVLTNFTTSAFATGKVGTGFHFTNPTNYVDAPMGGMAVGGGNFTVEGWIKAEPGNNTYTIISFGGAYYPTIYLGDTEGRLYMWSSGGFTPIGTGFKDGQFHHFAVVRQGNAADALKYYKDSVLLGSASPPYDLGASRCYIGWDQLPGDAFQGVIDELSFYNRALDPSEIAAIFNAGSAGKCTNSAPPNMPDISVTPTNLNFVNVAIGQGAFTNLTVSNRGNSTVTISSNSTFSNPQFSLPPNTLPLILAAGAQQVVLVVFAPTNGGPQSGTLTLNSSGQPAATVWLNGNAITNPVQATTLVAWGTNAQGQIGDGTTVTRPLPVLVNTSVVLAGKTVVAVSGGGYHSLALDLNGQVFAWGGGFYGELGNHSNTDISLPLAADMTGALNGLRVAAIAAGDKHSFVLTSQGRLFTCGRNFLGQLGIGTYTDTSAFAEVDMSGAVAGKFVTAIAAGFDNSYALASDGRVYAWGDNNFGQLGDGSDVSDSPLPVAVATNGVLAGKRVVAISAGGAHVLALTSDGLVIAWGDNMDGQLGNGSTLNTNQPTAVVTNGALAVKTVIAIAAGASHSLALTADGQLFSWGHGQYGQLGNGTTNSSPVPVPVNMGGALAGRIVIAIAAGSRYSAALTSDGLAFTWGFSPRLGNGSPSNALVPVPVDTSGVLANKAVTKLAGRSVHLLALAVGGTNANCQPTPTNLVSWWRAENSYADARGTNDGVRMNGVNFTNGMVGQGFSFNGTSNYVDAPMGGMAVGTGNFTVEGWIEAEPGGNNYTIISFGGPYFSTPTIWLGGSDGLLEMWPSDPAPIGTGFKDRQFHHFAVVREGNALKYYKDGGLLGSVNALNGLYATRCYIGWDQNPGKDAFQGVIDELSFYNRALDPIEIASIFVAGSAGKCTGTNSTGTNTITGPLIELNPTAPDFGFVGPGQFTEVSLTISNAGTATLVVSNFLLSNTNFTLISPASNSLTLATGAVQTVTLRFTPAAQGLEVGFLALSNNSAHGTFYVPLRGIGATASRPRGGLVFGWGYNYSGALGNGNGTEISTNRPDAVATNGVLAGKTITTISASGSPSLAVDSDGKVYSWGDNYLGALGNGSDVEYTNVPVAVNTSGVLNGKTVASAAGDSGHAVVLTTDGRIYSWGANDYGQLGIGTTISTNVPVAVNMNGALAGKRVAAIVTGLYSTIALASDGKVYTWGYNFAGQLGNGTTTNSSVPVAVDTSGVLNGKTVVAIAAGVRQSLALTSEGRVYGWGHDAGTLGTGTSTTTNRTVPVAVTTNSALAGEIVVGISDNFNGGIALASDGKVFTWGDDTFGILGRGPLGDTNAPVPVDMSGALAGRTVSAISSAGGFNTLVIAGTTVGTTNVSPQSSRLVAWGENVSGQLGYDGGSTTLPISVNTTGALAGKIVTAVAAGNYHSIALTSDGKVFGWGLNYAGQVGDGTHTNRFAPVPVLDGALAGRTITAIASGWYHNLALAADGTLYAWGDNSYGALGDGTGASSATPVAVSTSGALAGKTVIAIAAGGWHSLALTSDRRIYAWGIYGIGSGTTDSTGVPVAVDMTGALNGKTIVAIAAGLEHSLALTSEGKVYSWGYNSFGQLGITNWASFVPAPVLSGAFSGKFITAIAAGQAFSLAQASDGTVFSWGANGSGQLGNGDSSDAGVPVAVNMSGALNGKQVLNLKAGNAHALMIASDGKLYSWGINSSGELGIGPAPDSNVPVAVNTNGVLAGKTLSAIAAGYRHNLAIIGSPPAPPPILAGLAAQFNGSTLTLSWSAAINAQLETASSLTPPVTWVPATNTPVLVGDQQVVTLAPTGTLRFFRLAVTP